MANILSTNEIDDLLNVIQSDTSGKSDEDADSSIGYDFSAEQSEHKIFYDYKQPQIISEFQTEKLKKLFEDAVSDISSYFSKLLDNEITFSLPYQYDAVTQMTVETFIRACPNPTYLYTFEINGSHGYIEIDPLLFNHDFLKRTDESKETVKIGKFERSVCLNYIVKPILEKIKSMFYLDGKKCNFTKIENTDLHIKDAGNMAVCISIERKTSNKDSKEESLQLINIALPHNLVSKMKYDGILKNNEIVFISNEEGNAKAILGGFYIEDESKLEVGKIYELNKKHFESLDIVVDEKTIAYANPCLFWGNFSIEINQVIDNSGISCESLMEEHMTAGQYKKHANTKAILGRFVMPNSNKLEEKEIINLDRPASELLDIEYNGRLVAKAEIFVNSSIFGVKILNKI